MYSSTVKTIKKKNKIKCWYCYKYFYAGRSLTNHLNACSKKKGTSFLPCSNVKLQQDILDMQANQTLSLQQPDQENESELNKNEQNDLDLQAEFNHTFHVEDDNSEMVGDTEEIALVEKQKKYHDDTKEVEKMCTDGVLCQVDLLKRLKDLDCPVNAYDNIMDWALKWSTTKQHSRDSTSSQNVTSVFKDDSSTLKKRRKTVVNQLAKRFALDGLKPATKTIEWTDFQKNTCNIDITKFDFKEQLFCLLRDVKLMQPENLVFDGDKPGVPPNFNNKWISELNHGSWYENAYKYYETKFGPDNKRVICGIVLSIDKTHTDVKGKLCLEPVKFSLTLFNTETRRKNVNAWKRLGYINDLDAVQGLVDGFNHLPSDYSSMLSTDMSPSDEIKDSEASITENNVDRNIEAPNQTRKKLRNSDKKSMVYHKILSEILSDLKKTQNTGIYWRLKYPDGNYYDVKLYFPISMCVVDMKGGKQLCGMYDSYVNISRPCISCYCNSVELTDTNKRCTPVESNDIMEIIKHGDNDTLKSVSQLDNKMNAFFELELCSWKYGIWGLCPSEVLHQFYEGIVEYVLNEFYQEVLTDKYRHQLVLVCNKIVDHCRNQSDTDYPKGNFTLGITKTGRIKGIEKFASLFYLSLFLHMSISETKYFEGSKDAEDEIKKTHQVWRVLFEDLLYYHDWLLQTKFDRLKLGDYENKIMQLSKSIKKLVHRKGLGVNVPKFHEFFHIVRDIKRFGPPRGYDTCGNEGFLHEDKIQSKHTQRRIKSFNTQTSNRHYEGDVIDSTYHSLENYMINQGIKKDKKDPQLVGKNNDSINLRGPFQTFLSTEDGHITYEFKDAKKKLQQIANHDDFSPHLQKFLADCIFSLCEPVSDKIELICYTTMIRKGVSFRGASRTTSAEQSGWAMVQWTDPSDYNRQLFLCPAQIVMFVSFEKVQFRDVCSGVYPKNDLYAIIKSLEETPTENLGQAHYPMCQKCTLYEENCFHCVSVETLYDVAFVVPDIGGTDDSNKKYYHYVFPRYSNKHDAEQDDSDDNIVGWNRKF